MPCFSEGKSSLHHLPASHPFQVIEPHSIPIYTEDWGADEELLLLEGAETYGLGSWADIADHIGGYREKDEVRDHYIETYLESSKFPLPERASPANKTLSQEIPRDEFQARKKRRIESRKEAAKNSSAIAPPPKPTSSVPSCHEVAGYMPGRLEFEQEYFNEAEEAVQHMQFSPEEGYKPGTNEFDPETDLKMTVMTIYNDRLTARTDRKRTIFQHKLLEYRKNTAVDKRRTKEQRDLHNKLKPFARMMSHADFEAFSRDLEAEQNLRQAISQLQEWRRMQIDTLSSGEKYEQDKAARQARNMPNGVFDRMSNGIRVGKPPAPVETPNAVLELTARDLPVRGGPNGLHTPPDSDASPNGKFSTLPNGTGATPKRPPLAPIPNLTPMNMNNENAPDWQLLMPEEQDLCSKLRLQPKAYLCVKDAIFREAMKAEGKLKKKNVREIARIDTTKGGRIFEFFCAMGWIDNAAKS